MILYTLLQILEHVRGYIWRDESKGVELQEEPQEEPQELEEEPPAPLKRYNLRERKPVEYQD
jgi:hypothetical protein